MSEDYAELDETEAQYTSSDVKTSGQQKLEVDANSSDAQKEKRFILIRAVLGELLCSFLFIYIVIATSANFIRLKTPLNPVVGAVSTGFASVALIYSFADISGAHFNPAVTFATIITRKTGLTKGLAYMGAQLLGSVFASCILLATFPADNAGSQNIVYFVAVAPAVDANVGNAFLTELILTFILVYVIFAVAFDTVPSKDDVKVVNTGSGKQGNAQNAQQLTIYTTSGDTKAGFAPIAIGFTLGFLCFMGGSVSGGAFNPARVFGPALVGGQWSRHWVYWIADFLGAGMAGYCQKFFAHSKKSF